MNINEVHRAHAEAKACAEVKTNAGAEARAEVKAKNDEKVPDYLRCQICRSRVCPWF
jgi:hypothetical protein